MYRAKEASAIASSLFADLPMALAGFRSRSDSGRALTRRVCECACGCAFLEFDAEPHNMRIHRLSKERQADFEGCRHRTGPGLELRTLNVATSREHVDKNLIVIKTRNCARRPNWWYRTKYVKCHRRGVQSGDGSLALAQSGPRLRRRGQVRPRGTRDGVSAAAPRRRGAADVLEQRGAFPSPVVRRRTPRGGAAPASGTTRPAVKTRSREKPRPTPLGRPVRV